MRRVMMGLCLLIASPAWAEVSEKEALIAQTASALASADYARKKCPNLVIDDAKIQSNLVRAESNLKQLRKDESYTEQRAVIAALEQQYNKNMICSLLPAAHGGYGRGIINAR